MYAQRRKEFLRRLDGAAAIVPANHLAKREADTHFPFRQSSSFEYLTGFPEPDALAVFLPGHPEHEFAMFVLPRNREREIWDGKRFGPEGACREFGADAAWPVEDIDARMPDLLMNRNVLYHAFGKDSRLDERVSGWLAKAGARWREGISAPARFADPGEVLYEQRLIKDTHDLQYLRAAAKLSRDAHIHGMKVTRAGLNERQLQAEMEYYCRMRGSSAQAYTSIVAGGDSANCLHYIENNKDLRDGDLVLVDFGCEYSNYASDITRTWPVNGRFTEAQRQVYDLVLRSQEDGFRASKPGSTMRKIHEASTLALAKGLVEFGVLKGDPEVHMRVCIGDDKETKFPEGQPVLKDFYMHGTGHWIGLDVHDCGKYRVDGDWRKLEPGMCFTVEPGLYFGKDNPKTPERFRGIGVRIEDDVMVTSNGYEVLTAGLPRTAAEVEAACRGEYQAK